ncbi:MAG TPA: crossover junction endodeoxyribonuclease RuvC [Mesotoga sp.]|nr:crossover junction endodeoxyribonuclease RuvC [Mesotoga sp.]
MSQDVILGIDPGTGTTAWAILDAKTGSLEGYSKINPKRTSENTEKIIDISMSLKYVIRSLSEKDFRIAHSAIEDQFVKANASSGLLLSRLTGAIAMAIFEETGTIPHFVNQSSGKAAVGINPQQYKDSSYNKRRKEMQEDMVRNCRQLFAIPDDYELQHDEAAAMAIAHSLYLGLQEV